MRTLFAFLLVLVVFSGALADDTYSSEVGARAGLGYDSNAFKTPDSSYFDPVSHIFVKPDKEAGIFACYSLDANSEKKVDIASWLTQGKVRGRNYLNRSLKNADEYYANLSTGLEFTLDKEGKAANTLYIGPLAAFDYKTYFDRDDGEEKFTSTTSESLADRYKYFKYGFEGELALHALPVKTNLKIEVARYDYENVPVVSSGDYTYFAARASASYRIFKPAKISFDYTYRERRYDERLSRSENGDLLASNPHLRYSYQDLAATLLQELTRNLNLYFDYGLAYRIDDYAGYNDYTENTCAARLKFKTSDRLFMYAKLYYRDRDYQRAFAFDDPAYPKKRLITRGAELRQEVPLQGGWIVWASQEYLNQNSSDPRYEYDRYQLAVGGELRW